MPKKTTKAYVVHDENSPFVYESIKLRERDVNDVEVEFMCSGLCHTDHSMKINNWKISQYPMVPGHEGIGIVKKLGSSVKHLSVGDIVGVGWMCNSCGTCRNCLKGEENICDKGYEGTYLGDHSMGGTFSRTQVINGKFVFKIPDGYPPAAAAPLLCAGITVYSPLRKYVSAGSRVGIISLGGLGHLGVLLAKAMGAHVTVFSTSDSKKDVAINHLKANEFVNTKKKEDLARVAGKVDFILNTCPYPIDTTTFMDCLANDGVLCFVGIPTAGKDTVEVGMNGLVFSQKSIVGSIVGGTKYMTEMFELCKSHNIVPDVEVVRFDTIDKSMKKMVDGKMAKSRYVLAHDEYYEHLQKADKIRK